MIFWSQIRWEIKMEITTGNDLEIILIRPIQWFINKNILIKQTIQYITTKDIQQNRWHKAFVRFASEKKNDSTK